MENPYEILLNEVKEVKSILITLRNQPNKELLNKFYSIKEASKILKLDPQTVKSHITKGTLKAVKIGRLYRIKHFDLYDSQNEVKFLKYKR